MVFGTLIFLLILSVLFIFIIRYKGIQAYSDLVSCFQNICHEHEGRINDTGEMETLSAEFKDNNSHFVINTVKTGRTGFIDSYAILISKKNSGNRRMSKKISLADALYCF